MALREFVPSADLQPWVDRIWIRSAGCLPETIAILPDGCADIVLDRSGLPGPFSGAFAVGPMTRPLMLDGQTPPLIGIRFRPGRAAAFLGMPLAEITDERVPLRSWRHLAEEPNIAQIERVLRRCVSDAVAEQRVDGAVAAILKSGGTASVEAIARAIGISRQHLGRLFDHHVGVTPKMFARIVRFRRAARLGRSKPWADVAVTLGYSDQSHLIADFREFAGTTPVPFFLSAAAKAR